jgi:hypothetical protein
MIEISEENLILLCKELDLPNIFDPHNEYNYWVVKERKERFEEVIKKQITLKDILPKLKQEIINNNLLLFLDKEGLKKKVKPKGLFENKNVFNTEILKSKILDSRNGWVGYGNDETCFMIDDHEMYCYRHNRCRLIDCGGTKRVSFYNNIQIELNIEFYFEMDNFLREIYKKILKKEILNIIKKELKTISDELLKIKNKLEESKSYVLLKLDKDNNGKIDIIEDKNEFNLLLKKHQKIVIEKGKEFNQNYTHQFIKVGNYIKKKRSNLQLIFDCIKQVQNQKDLDEYVEILESEIHSYNLLLINSLNLIVSLIEDDQITFYDIYEKFDKLNIFNSNWENDMSHKLTNLNKGISELNSNIKGLMFEIRDMGDKIVNSIDDLSYITEESTRMLDNRLGEIDSSIKTNNLLTLISTYQTYKINQNTKSLRG